MPSCSAPAPPSRAICPSKAATSRASTSRWSSSRQHQGAARPAQERQLHLRRRARTSSSSAAATPAPTASAPRCATAARASCSSRSCPKPPMERADGQSLAGVAEGLQARLRPGGSRRQIRRRSARLSHHRDEVRRRRQRPRQGRAHRASRVGQERQGPVHPEERPRHREGRCPRSSSCWRWASSGPSNRCSTRSASSATRARNVKAELRQIHDEHPGRLRRRRLPPRPKPRRLGLQRRPRRRPRVRPLPDGRDGSAVRLRAVGAFRVFVGLAWNRYYRWLRLPVRPARRSGPAGCERARGRRIVGSPSQATRSPQP